MSRTLFLIILWTITGYLNGYDDGTEKEYKGAKFVVISLVILLVICIIGEIAQKVVMK